MAAPALDIIGQLEEFTHHARKTRCSTEFPDRACNALIRQVRELDPDAGRRAIGVLMQVANLADQCADADRGYPGQEIALKTTPIWAIGELATAPDLAVPFLASNLRLAKFTRYQTRSPSGDVSNGTEILQDCLARTCLQALTKYGRRAEPARFAITEALEHRCSAVRNLALDLICTLNAA